jgi:predicted nucleic acid-binding Zn finger protein
MITLTPRTAAEALRMVKADEAAQAGDFDVWPNGDGTATVDSWKTIDGKRKFSRYAVNLNEGKCTCQDFIKRGRFCKHLLLVDDMARAEAQEDFLQSMIDGEEFMQNLFAERSIH